MTRITRLSMWISLSAAASLLVACGGGSPRPSDDTDLGLDLPMQETLDVQHAPAEIGQRDLAGEEKPTVESRYELFLYVDNTEPVTVMPADSYKFRARVLDYAQGAPAAGLGLHYEFVKVEDLSGNPAAGFDGSFEAADMTTDEEGFTENRFRTCTDCTNIVEGQGCNLRYTIEVSLPDQTDPEDPPLAEPQTFEVIVPCKACGCANVRLSNEAGLPLGDLSDIDIYVLPNDYACSSLFPGRPVPPHVIADRSIGDLMGSTSFECLDADTRYTFFALGHRSGSPCVVASGCNDGVYLEPDKCKDYTLKLYQATLSPVGVYDCIDHFDFTNMVKQCAGGDTTILTCVSGVSDLGKTVCCVLAEMIKFFQTPGSTIVETLVDVAKQFLGSIIVDTVANLFKDAVAKIITGWLLNNSPPFIKDFFTIGGDMMGTITNLEMMSDLSLNKLNNDYTMQGNQFWHGLALYWKFGCDTSAPDYEQCGRIALDLESLNDPLFPTDLLGGKFTAMLADFDKLIINQHAIKLNYGKLVLYVLNEVIIKSITGGKAHSLKEVAYLWIDCKSVAQGILGEIFSWFGGSQGDLEGVCKTTIDFLFGFVDAFVNALSLDTEMSISGFAQLVDIPNPDQQCDLKADKITKGKNVGYVQGTSSQASITGDFECVIQ